MKMNGALGVIEVRGLSTAIVAVDAAMKAANVTYVNYFKSGSGGIQVRLVGEVSAVQAAVAAGKAAASKNGWIIGAYVIPRPHEDVKKIISRYGLKKNKIFVDEPKAEAGTGEEPAAGAEAAGDAKTEAAKEPASEVEDAEDAEAEAEKEPISEVEAAEDAEAEAVKETASEPETQEEPEKETGEEPEMAEQTDEREITCNLCHDPACPRMRGQPRKLCIHYGDT